MKLPEDIDEFMDAVIRLNEELTRDFRSGRFTPDDVPEMIDELLLSTERNKMVLGAFINQHMGSIPDDVLAQLLDMAELVTQTNNDSIALLRQMQS